MSWVGEVSADPLIHQEFAMALVKARGEAKAQDVLALQNLGLNQQNLSGWFQYQQSNLTHIFHRS